MEVNTTAPGESNLTERAITKNNLTIWDREKCEVMTLAYSDAVNSPPPSSSQLSDWTRSGNIRAPIKDHYQRFTIDRDNQASFSLIIKLFHHFSPNLSNSAHDSPDQPDDRIKSNIIFEVPTD